MKKLTALLLVPVILVSLCSCGELKSTKSEFALNTAVSITAYGDKADEASAAAIAEVKRIENLLSAHLPGSDISKINSDAFKAPVKVSKETVEVLKKALDMSKKTKGAFDISIKPLMDLWDINSENPKVPSDADIQAALDKVGYENIVIDGDSVSFKKEGMAIDLGGAAKGYAADKLCELLKSYGIKNALIDLGGNIYAMGKNDKGGKWRIGLQKPQGERGEYFSVEEVSGKTVVSSGSYERYFESDSKIYHHIMDPKTGYPANSGLISVNVIGDNSFEADMLSTAIFIMGSIKFNELKEDFNYDKFITVSRDNFARTYTKAEK